MVVRSCRTSACSTACCACYRGEWSRPGSSSRPTARDLATTQSADVATGAASPARRDADGVAVRIPRVDARAARATGGTHDLGDLDIAELAHGGLLEMQLRLCATAHAGVIEHVPCRAFGGLSMRRLVGNRCHCVDT